MTYVWMSVGMFAALVIVLLVIVATLRKGEREFESAGRIKQDFGPTILFKVFVTWAQTISVLVSLDVDWPTIVRTFFSAAAGTSYFGETLIQINCTPIATTYYQKAIFFCSFPLLLIVITALLSARTSS